MSKEIKIIDNVLEKEQFKDIQALMTSLHFPWFYSPTITSKDEKTKLYYFVHLFFDNFQKNSSFFDLLSPLFKILEVNSLIRIKGNMYPNVNKKIQNDFHIDYPYEHKNAIFYINSNNGPTVFKSGEKIESVENRILFFNAGKKHSSTNCTNKNARFNINLNYF